MAGLGQGIPAACRAGDAFLSVPFPEAAHAAVIYSSLSEQAALSSPERLGKEARKKDQPWGQGQE